MSNVAAWAPTFALLVLFKKISPDISFWDYVKKAFSRKIKFIHFVFSLGIQLLIIVLAILFYLIITKQELQTLALFPFATILLNIFITITSGPLGEELGWREYALNVFQQKHSPLKSSIILGIFWGLWHLPLWLLSGFSGVDLLLYIVGFMVGIIATSVI
ncbi:MAG: CPBP family intramembrane metalloprotease, partial [Cyclobacteriaceae bacterium]|nr:CPBP family intramembrane metalloprotease [Cyclobacteriaceae bacterium]